MTGFDWNGWMRRAADPDDPFPNGVDESNPAWDAATRPQPAPDLDAPSRPGQRRTWGPTDYPLDRGNDPATSDERNQQPGRNLPVWGGNDLQESGGGPIQPPPRFDAAPPWHPSTNPDDVTYPVDTRGPGQRPYDVTDREGLDRSNDDEQRAGAPPRPAPNNVLNDWQQAQPAGTIYRAPSLPPSVAARWQQRVGAPMTAEDVAQLRALGVIA